MMIIPNIKALCIVVADKRLFNIFPTLAYVKHVTRGRGHFWPQEHNLNKFGRGSLGDATYQIARLYVL